MCVFLSIILYQIKKREAITYLSCSTCKVYLHVQLLDTRFTAAVISNNSEITKFIIINLIDTDTILPRTILSES